MCGIAGIVHANSAAPVSAPTLVAMRDSLAHRGPDDSGEYFGPGVGLGARRLAIVDLSVRGHMPMSTPDGRYWIVYNGMIYNYRELRSRLASHTLRSNTDTEVLLQLYAAEGPAVLDRLNGMFAFAIWDSRDRTLFLARDRLGVKPLYYAFKGEALYFASEEKALWSAGIPATFDTSTWEELLCFRYVAGERTPFKGIKRLLPGHHLTWSAGRTTLRRWWSLADRARALRDAPPADPVRWFQETFDSAVDIRRISDVPVGVLLSGGLDSSSVAASLSMQNGGGVASFTMRFDEAGYDEGETARGAAALWRLEHHEMTLPREGIVDRLAKASWLSDEPLVHASDLHLLAISQYAKPMVSVLLSGEGADETLDGYVRYRPLRYRPLFSVARYVLPRLIRRFHIEGRLRKLSSFLTLGPLDLFVLFNACDVLPHELESVGVQPREPFEFRRKVLAEAEALYPVDPVRQAMYSDQLTFLGSILDRNDRMTMGASIECRIPFLDYRLIEGLAAMPSSVLLAGSQGKSLLRRAVGSRLPEQVRRNPKWGFGVPWTRYLREIPALRDIVLDLPSSEPIRSGPFDPSKLRSIVRKFVDGDSRHEALVRQLVMIAAWHTACIQGRMVADPPGVLGGPARMQ
jgi:asparagine synthase (glutamine-hydrolysing)